MPERRNTETLSRRKVVRELERSHAVPPRSEVNKERTNATARSQKREKPAAK